MQQAQLPSSPQQVAPGLGHSVARESQFRYSPLPCTDSIRLLILQPGDADEPIHCHLIDTRLDEAPPFDCISYTWGNVAERREIWIDKRSLYVTRSLRDALRQARDADQELCLWADAACIDQTNVEERSHQVGVMDRIYKRAQHVFVCLGAEVRDDGRGAVKLLSNVNAVIEAQIKHYGSYQKIPTMLASGQYQYESFNWTACMQMLLHPWFSRTWVVQEIGLARTGIILYGRERISWYSLMLMTAWLSQVASHLSHSTGMYDLNMQTFWRLWLSFDPRQRSAIGSRTSPRSFLDVLNSTRRFDATDSRDYLYALMGHQTAQKEGILNFLKPDYQRSVVDIYVDFFVDWINYNHCADILGYISANDEIATSDFPSWCPRWDLPPTVSSPLLRPQSRDYFNASGSDNFHLRVLDRKRIQVSGFIFDGIDAKSRSITLANILRFDDTRTFRRNLAIPNFFAAIAEREKDSPFSYDSTWKAFARTADAWEHGRREKKEQLSNFASYMLDISRNGAVVEESVLRQFETLAALGGDAEDFEIDSLETVNGRAFFTTRNGYIGIGHNSLKVGDLVCVIFGYKMALLLRPAGNWTYTVQGECYLDGIMDGEAMQMLEHGKFKKQSFILV